VIREVMCAVALAATPIVAGLVGIPAKADPLTSAEVTFLHDVHQNAPDIGETDAQLLGDGWYACHNRAMGLSITALGVSPVVAQWAIADLCPNGCPQGCLHP
jgi:hypothetical protein